MIVAHAVFKESLVITLQCYFPPGLFSNVFPCLGGPSFPKKDFILLCIPVGVVDPPPSAEALLPPGVGVLLAGGLVVHPGVVVLPGIPPPLAFKSSPKADTPSSSSMYFRRPTLI